MPLYPNLAPSRTMAFSTSALPRLFPFPSPSPSKFTAPTPSFSSFRPPSAAAQPDPADQVVQKDANEKPKAVDSKPPKKPVFSSNLYIPSTCN